MLSIAGSMIVNSVLTAGLAAWGVFGPAGSSDMRAAAQLAIYNTPDLAAEDSVESRTLALASPQPDSARIKLLLGRAMMYQAQGKFTQAEARFRSALALNPKHKQTKLMLLRLLWYTNKRESRILALEILHANPNDPSANMVMAHHFAVSVDGDIKQAAKYAERATVGGHPDGLYARSLVLYRTNKYGDAIKALSDALHWRIDHRGFVLIHPSDLYLERAGLYISMGRHNDALADVSQAVQLWSYPLRIDDVRAKGIAWWCYYGIGCYDACEAIRKEIDKNGDPNNSIRLYVDAATDLALGRRKEVEAGLSKLAPFVRRRPLVASGYLAILAGLGYHSEALQSIKDADGTFFARMQTLIECKAFLLSSSADPTVRDGKAALAAAKELCARTHDGHPRHLMLHALALAECREFDKAVERIKLAIKKLPPGAPIRAEYQRRMELFLKKQPFRHDQKNKFFDMISY